MNDLEKTKEQLLAEIADLRRQVAAVQTAGATGQRLGSPPFPDPAYRALAANIPGIVYRVLIRDKYRMRFFNNMLSPMTGYREDELCVGEVCQIDPLILPEDRHEMVSVVRNAVSENRSFKVSYRIRDKQGNIRWFLEYGRPIYGTDGSPEFIDGVIVENTVLQAVSELMREANDQFQALLNATADVALLIDPSGTLLALNKTLAERLGSPVEDLLGRRIWDYLPPDAAERGKKLLNTAVTQRVPIREEEPTGDGVLDMSMYPILDADGRVKAVAVFARDITEEKRAAEALAEVRGELELRVKDRTAELMAVNEQLRREIVRRKRSEDAVRESEERFRTLVESSPYGIGIASKGLAVFANNALVKMLGVKSVTEIVGRPIIQFVHPDYRAIAIDHIRQVVQDGAIIHDPNQKLLRKDGGLVDAEITAIPFQYMGQPAVEAVFNDVTEQKRANEQLEASLKEKEILLREIHHRVKNNLQVISSLLRLQARDIDESAYRLMFEESQNRLQVMALIHERLYQSQNLSDIDFCSYLRTLAAYLFGSFGANTARIEFIMKSKDQQLGVDTAATCGLIANELISNSLKHAFPDGRKGVIEVSLSAKDGDYVFVVSDNGVGFRGPFDWKSERTLGLRLVRTLAKQLHGDMKLALGIGTTFVLTFPMRNDEKA